MKKSKIWIRICVHLLVCTTFGVHSSEFGDAVTDDITSISLLKQNIPKDYKIPVTYIPKEVGGMCWVTLNVFHLELSLRGLADKFGNISSNKYNISILIEMLKETRYHMKNLEVITSDFECHYRDEKWQTGHYFQFVEDFLNTARSNRDLPEECDPPPCPTTTKASATTITTQYPASGKEPLRFLPEVVERSLLSLLVIPIAAIIFLFVWKVKSRSNQHQSDELKSVEGGHFTGTEESLAPPLDDISEKNRLNIIEAV
ncbi:kit ligand isoform X1 [Oncorhynchus tshawytscha]|uniref:Kit ligand n=2 Tax=Oncorhynchus tshawytscha TaxID=74940 RepID=A0A8C8INH3_ONCTS|nr:kit ligand isoform X1 [Oncorhynchus tshawytscha]